MKLSPDKKVIFDSEKEKNLYYDLKEYLLNSYKGKRNLQRLINNISWFINEKRGDFFAGFVFDVQGTLSCWGIYPGGKDTEKDAAYKSFMRDYCEDLMEKKDKKDNFVSFAILVVYNKLVKSMLEMKLITED